MENLALVNDHSNLGSMEKKDGSFDEKLRNAQAVNRVVFALSEARTVGDAAKAALDAIRDAFGWAYGSYWSVDHKERVLRFTIESGAVNADFRRCTESASFEEGVGLSGRAWKQKDLVFVDDLGQMTDCVRAPIAQKAGVKSGFCFPVLVSGQVAGTMDFFSMDNLHPSSDLMNSLRNVGKTVSATLERLRNEVEMSRIFSIIENAPINIMSADLDLRLNYINPKSRETLKSLQHLLPMPVDKLIGQSVDIFHKSPEHQRRILKDDKNLPHRAKIQLGDEILDLLVSPIYDGNKKYLGPMVTWSVITDQVALANTLEETANNLASAAAELTATATLMSGNAGKTSQESNSAAAAAEEVARGVQTMATNTEEMTASIKEIARSSSEAANLSKDTVKRANETNKTMQQLGVSSQEIGNVIKVISSIAQQTNLLALNATIEAARAGDAGKGFAVVANEVKELAKQTAKATDEITAKIGAIQQDTKSSVEAIGGIGTVIEKLNGISMTIAAAVEEQSATTNEVTRIVQESRKAVDGIAKTVKTVSTAATESATGASQTLDAAKGLTDLAEKLKALVKKARG